MSKGNNTGRGLVLIVLALAILGLVWGVQKAPVGQDLEVSKSREPSQAAAPITHSQVQAKADRKVRLPLSSKSLDDGMRKQRLAAILAKLGQGAQHQAGRAVEAAAAKTPDTSQIKGSLPAQFIKDAMGEILPLFAECYQMALAQQAGIEAKLTVRFEIVGDEEYGGLVTKSEIIVDENERAPNALLAECVQESMYALDLPKPEGGGRVVVTYPFVFKLSKETDR
jgi:hypothetical protein